MEVKPLEIPDIKIIRPTRLKDSRGFFSEIYNKRAFREAGIDSEFVQDNHSLSARGVVRGLHFQIEPFAQSKLVRVVKGAIFDVAVDLRRNSPTFGRHVAAVISERDWNQILVPVGFAHGFCAIEPDTEVVYKVTNYYSPTHDKGLYWADPALGIVWPIAEAEAVVSEKDKCLPRFSGAERFFE